LELRLPNASRQHQVGEPLSAGTIDARAVPALAAKGEFPSATQVTLLRNVS
jgi:hypothetical protein